MTARIVLTGMGVVSPYGVGPHLLWEKLLAGESGIRPLTSCDLSHVRCQSGGQWADFRHEDFLSPRLVRRIDRFSQFGIIAAQHACADAHVLPDDDASSPAPTAPWGTEGQDRVGITVGNNLGGWEFAERELTTLWQKGPREVSPYMATAWFPAAAQGNISIHLGIKGIGRTFLADRIGGAYALKHAAQCLRAGYADGMFAGGTEAPFSPYAALCYETSGLMSTQTATRPTSAYRPFDREHNGLVAGEGAAFLFLEREEDAVRRGATIYAELAGWDATTDAYDAIRPQPNGVRFAATMRRAMQRAHITAEQVDCVFAAGSAVPEEDIAEARAIRLALCRYAQHIPVTAPKAAFGNLFGAATPVDVVIALLALRHRVIPPTLHLDTIAPECMLDFVVKQPRPVDRLDVLALNARGIGGTNACLILRRWSPQKTTHE